MELKRYKDFIIKESKEDKDLWIYEGDFDVNKLMIMDGKFIKDKIPDIITGYFSCSYMKLTTLEGAPREIGKFFNCYNNKLLSLKGGPKKVGGCFDCRYNQLTSLEGSPKKIEGNFKCSSNQLTSLEGGPLKVKYQFVCPNNKLTSLEGAPKEIGFDIFTEFTIENFFINSRSYINNYWMDLLKYMIDEKIDLSEVKGWPEGFLNDEKTIKSVKGISKFKI